MYTEDKTSIMGHFFALIRILFENVKVDEVRII